MHPAKLCCDLGCSCSVFCVQAKGLPHQPWHLTSLLVYVSKMQSALAEDGAENSQTVPPTAAAAAATFGLAPPSSWLHGAEIALIDCVQQARNSASSTGNNSRSNEVDMSLTNAYLMSRLLGALPILGIKREIVCSCFGVAADGFVAADYSLPRAAISCYINAVCTFKAHYGQLPPPK